MSVSLKLMKVICVLAGKFISSYSIHVQSAFINSLHNDLKLALVLSTFLAFKSQSFHTGMVALCSSLNCEMCIDASEKCADPYTGSFSFPCLSGTCAKAEYKDSNGDELGKRILHNSSLHQPMDEKDTLMHYIILLPQCFLRTSTYNRVIMVITRRRIRQNFFSLEPSLRNAFFARDTHKRL